MEKLSIHIARKVFSEYLQSDGYNGKTVQTKLMYIDHFFSYFCEHYPDIDLRDIKVDEMKAFCRYLDAVVSKRTEKPFARRTKMAIISAVRMLFQSLYTQDLLISNPLEDFSAPARGTEMRRAVLTEEEMNMFLESLDPATPLGLRDRAMFELLYSSGLRVSEVVKMKVSDVDFERRMLFIRESKWNSERIVPANDVAFHFLKQYISMNKKNPNDLVFSGKEGRRFSGSSVNRRFKKLLRDVDLYRANLSVHSIRHSVSVHLLAHNADIRYVQELLGHRSVETTVGYTETQTENLKRVYRTYHPRENGLYQEIDNHYRVKLEVLRSELTSEERLTTLRAHRRRREERQRSKKNEGSQS